MPHLKGKRARIEQYEDCGTDFMHFLDFPIIQWIDVDLGIIFGLIIFRIGYSCFPQIWKSWIWGKTYVGFGFIWIDLDGFGLIWIDSLGRWQAVP